MSAPTSADVKAMADRIGFAACGIASLEPSARGDALDRWLANGFAGTMRYLHRQARKRKAPALITQGGGARRAIVVLENYAAPDDEKCREGDEFRIASYARGADYHRVTLGRLQQLSEWLISQGATIAHAWVDSGPVPERELAERAGLGWIGKNTMLIHPRIGSWTFIGTVLTDLELDRDESNAHDRCGRCTRCIDACPTEALLGDHVLDATRCLSYHTIESRRGMPPEIAEHSERWAFGCDICNDVCPWNVRFATPTTIPEFARRPDPDCRDPEAFTTLTPAAFDERYGDTPLARAGLDRMRRNVTTAIANAHSTLPVAP